MTVLLPADGLHVVIGAGPLGRAVARALAESGCPVRLVTRSGTASDMPGVTPFGADIMMQQEAVAACAGAATIYQCASPAYHRWPQDFPILQANILTAAQAAGAVLVAANNLYDYGVAGSLTEDLPLTAGTRKGAVRAQLSNALLEAYAAGHVRVVIGRASDFLGPEVRNAALGDRLWPALLEGKPVNWFGDPDVAHSVTYVPDYARALIVLGATEVAWGQAWHVPSAPPQTIRALLARAARLAGLPAPRIRKTPAILLRAVGLVVPAAGEVVEMRYSYAAPFVINHGKWDEAFGTEATDLDAALQATIDWWRAESTEPGAKHKSMPAPR